MEDFRESRRTEKIWNLFLLVAFSMTLQLSAADSKPTPTISPVPSPVRRLKMGDVDKKETHWWKRTQKFLETGIAVGLFFWIPGAHIDYRSDNLTISK